MTRIAVPVTARAFRTRERLNRWSRTVLDGRHPWGALMIGPVDRTACAMSYRLLVYPPGIAPAERRALVFARHWPASGTALGLLTAALLGVVLNGWLALALGAVIFGAGFAVPPMVAGDARRRVIRLRATVVSTMGHHEVLGDLAELERAAGLLLGLDELDGSGELSPVDYEYLWNRVYQELAAPRLGV